MFPHPDAPKIRAQVEAYFDKNWLSSGIPYQFTRTCSEAREQIIDIATTIKMNEMGIDTRPGSFIRAFLNNDLKATFAQADSINRECIGFYLTMSYNLTIVYKTNKYTDSMKQLENYTGSNFDDDLFHYCGNNNYFVSATLLPNSEEFTRENNKMYSSIKVPESLAVEKLGESNFISEWGTNYWIYEFNGNLFYYQNDMQGSTVGIFCKKKDKTKNWLFEPAEYEYQESEELGLKMLAFCKALSDKLNQ